MQKDNENKNYQRRRESSRREHHTRDDHQQGYEPPQTVSSIAKLKARDYFKGTVKILRKTQPGPVIFTVSDGEGSVDAVTKESDFETDDVVELSGKASARAGKLQIEIDDMRKSDLDFSKIIDEKSEPTKKEFSIKSERYQKLKPYFYAIAKRIRRAILDNEPIMIRHHADADGIIAGLCIEKSCEALMKKSGINPDYNLHRSPSKAPFYEKTDVLRDITYAKRLTEEHKQKKPIIIVLDNGSTPEDVFAMKLLHMLSYEVIVIDHHNPVILKNKKTAVCQYLALHLNPYIEGFDGKTSAGMLSYEVARLIHDGFENPVMPAISAISDRCDINETEEYIKQTHKTREELNKKGIAIDYIAYHLKFDSGKGIFDELIINEKLVDLINEEVTKGVETQLQSTLPYLRTQDINGIIFSYIDLEKYTLRFTYPTPGKITGIIHDEVSEGKENFPVITLGYMSDMVILRATKPVLPIAKIIETLRKDIPEANVDGGGHECAGTIKFVSAHLTTIIENIKQQIRKLDYIKKIEDNVC